MTNTFVAKKLPTGESWKKFERWNNKIPSRLCFNKKVRALEKCIPVPWDIGRDPEWLLLKAHGIPYNHSFSFFLVLFVNACFENKSFLGIAIESIYLTPVEHISFLAILSKMTIGTFELTLVFTGPSELVLYSYCIYTPRTMLINIFYHLIC